MQRFFLALHATVPAALLVAVFVHLWGPAGLAPLAQRPVWTVWVLIAVWLLMSALAAWALRTLALWRVALGSTGALLAVAALTGLALGSALAPAMALSLAATGLACAGVAAFMGPQRVQQAHRRRGSRPSIAITPAAPRHVVSHTGRPWPLAPLAHLPFWLCAALAVESFRLAHIVAVEPARSAGMLGLLLSFFVGLPAATVRTWAPRTSALLWLLAGLACAGLAAKAGLQQGWVAAMLCTAAACSSVRPLHHRLGARGLGHRSRTRHTPRHPQPSETA